MTVITENITQAVKILHNGGLVAFPTETVYGLGADAANELAVRKVFQAKGRPADHPLIVHIARLEQLNDWAKEVSETALMLANTFWPGPLTLVLNKKPAVLESVTGGQATVAVRMPNHPVARALLEAFGGGLVAPSANRFTRISPTTASAVLEELGESVELILDGGACAVGLESTIVDVSGDEPMILRPGMITAEDIASVINRPVTVAEQETPVRAPGMHHLHYAPTTNTRLMSTAELSAAVSALREDETPVVCVVYSDITFPAKAGVEWVIMPAEAHAYAHDLYRTLRSVDSEHYRQIWIEAVPQTPVWEAIRDRLIKAAGKR